MKFTQTVLILSILLQLCLSARVPEIMPILSLDEGQFKGLALKVEGSDAVMILSGHTRPGLDAILTSGDEGTLIPFALQIDTPRDSMIDCDWSYLETPIVSDPSNQDLMIKSNTGWALLSFSDKNGTELPTLKTFPVSLTDQQAKRISMLTTNIELEATERIHGGGLLLKDDQVIGITKRANSSVKPRNINGTNNQSNTIYTTGLKLYPLRYLKQGDTPAREDLAPHLHRLTGDGSWPDGPPSMDSPIKKYQIEMQPIKMSSYPSFRFYLHAYSLGGNAAFPAIMDDDGNLSAMINLNKLFGEGDATNLELKTAERTISGEVKNIEVATQNGRRKISGLGTLPRSEGKYEKPTYPANRILNITQAIDNVTNSILAEWSEVTSFSVRRKVRRDSAFIRLEYESEPGKWRRLAEEKFDLKPGSEEKDQHTNSTVEANDSALEFNSYNITVTTETKSTRLTGDKRFWVHLDKANRIHIRETSNLKRVAIIDTSTEQEVAESFQIDRRFIYLLDKANQRVLCYNIETGRLQKTLRLEQFGLGQDFTLLGMAASPLASGECVITAKHLKERDYRLIRIDAVSNDILFSRKIDGFGRLDRGECIMVSPYWLSFGSSTAYTLYETTEGKLSQYGAIPYSSAKWNDRDVRYRGQGIRRDFFPQIDTESPYGGAGIHSGALVKKVRQSPQTIPSENYLYVDEPIHFVISPDSSLDEVIPVWSNNPPVKLDILIAPSAYALDDDQRLQVAPNTEPQRAPDFILMRATDAIGKSNDFWVTIDRRYRGR